MAADPVLVLQMQRMGDLILSFPLFLWLRRCYPGREILVVAEEVFFRPLMPVSPPATYVSWAAAEAGALAGRRFRLIVNLSIRPEAARLAGELTADIKVGRLREADGSLRVRGGWQLYRAALAGQGRHNRFHWADLNALDMIPLSAFQATEFSPPRVPTEDCRPVGLFIGASEEAKRPGPDFAAALARALLSRGLHPVLLGGPADRPLADAIRRRTGAQHLMDLVGRLTLSELAEYGRGLALMITPDTGPMHLAAWTALPTINLSVGPVSPWDTGPFQPGHLVLRSAASCARGCWGCSRAVAGCREGLRPEPVAALAALAVRGRRDRLERMALPGFAVFETGRTAEGLYDLRRLGPAAGEAPGVGDLAGEFWRRVFLWRLQRQPLEAAAQAWRLLAESKPRLAGSLSASLPGLSRRVAGMARGEGAGALCPGTPPFWRPLAAWLEMSAQNEDASAQWAAASLETIEALSRIM